MDTRTEFARGVEAFRTKNYELARDQFQKVSQENPDDPNVHLNLALTFQELKDPYLAIAHLRAAEEVAGHTRESEAVAHQLQLQNGRDLTSQTENFSFLQTLNQKVLMDVSLWGLSSVASLLILSSLWLWIIRRIKGRAAYFYPALFSALSIFLIILVALKFEIQREHRGTVVAKESPLFVEADTSSPQLLTVPQGQYLLVKEAKPDWYRVEIEGIGVGYMKAEQIFMREKM